MSSFRLFHALQTRSGFGDRIVDLWAALTVAKINYPNTVLYVTWPEGQDYTNSSRDYQTDLFSLNACEFIDAPPTDIAEVNYNFSNDYLNETAIANVSSGVQLILRAGAIWGNNSPDRLYHDRQFYGFEPTLGANQIADVYAQVAQATRPCTDIQAMIPNDIGQRIGIHIRRTDKIVTNERSIDMSVATWQSIEEKALRCIDQCILQNQKMFICSDDTAYKTQLLERIAAQGGDAVTIAPIHPNEKRHGFDALTDFFALSQCASILQMTKYSTFSIAAAILGAAPIANLYESANEDDHRLTIWRSTLRNLIV